MVVEPLPFLIFVGIKNGRVNIKKHEFWFSDEINDLAQFAHDLVQLSQRILIHPVKNRDKVGCDARVSFSQMAVMTGLLVNSSTQSSSKYALII